MWTVRKIEGKKLLYITIYFNSAKKIASSYYSPKQKDKINSIYPFYFSSYKALFSSLCILHFWIFGKEFITFDVLNVD